MIKVFPALMRKREPSGEPITWTENTNHPFTADKPAYALGYANGIWVAGGAGGTICTAVDPTGKWTSRTSNLGNANINHIEYGNGIWAATTEAGWIATAVNPIGVWTVRSSRFTTSAPNGFGYGNSKWVYAAGDRHIFTASNPALVWAENTSHPYTVGHPTDVRYDNSIWVMGGSPGASGEANIATAVSATGTWTRRTNPFYNCVGAWYGNGIWVAGGSSKPYGANPLLATASTPTSTWTSRTVPLSGVDKPLQPCYGANAWVVFTSFTTSKILTTLTPTGTWNLRTNPVAAQITRVRYGDGHWVGVCHPGKIITAVPGV